MAEFPRAIVIPIVVSMPITLAGITAPRHISNSDD